MHNAMDHARTSGDMVYSLVKLTNLNVAAYDIPPTPLIQFANRYSCKKKTLCPVTAVLKETRNGHDAFPLLPALRPFAKQVCKLSISDDETLLSGG